MNCLLTISSENYEESIEKTLSKKFSELNEVSGYKCPKSEKHKKIKMTNEGQIH